MGNMNRINLYANWKKGETVIPVQNFEVVISFLSI